MDTKTKPSLIQICWNDWPVLAVNIAITMFTGLFGFMAYRDGDRSWIAMLIVLLAIFLVVLLSRIIRVYLLFHSGKATEGKITALSIVKDRGRLEYEYEVEGTMLRSWAPIHRTKRVFECAKAQNVNVLYDDENPRNSIVMQLFLPMRKFEDKKGDDPIEA